MTMEKESNKFDNLLSEGESVVTFITGRPKIDRMQLFEKTKQFVASLESPFGPFLFEGDPWKHVYENGLHVLEPDIHLLNHFCEITLSYQEDSGYLVLIPLNPGQGTMNIFDFPYAPQVASFVVDHLENPVQWVIITRNETVIGALEPLPLSTFCRHIDKDTDLHVSEEACTYFDYNGRKLRTLTGFTHLVEVVGPGLENYLSDNGLLKDGVLLPDASSDDEQIEKMISLLDILLNAVKDKTGPFNMFELEYGPITKLYPLITNAIEFKMSQRSKRLADNYKTFSDKFMVSPSSARVNNPILSFYYLDGDFDIIKSSVLVECETCGNCPLDVDERFSHSSVVSIEDFFT